MNLGMVGLGRMGANMTERLREHGHTVETYARTNPERTANSLVDLAGSLPQPRVIWLMIPAGDPTENAFQTLLGLLEDGDVIIDGGNSNFHDTMRRAADLETKGIHLVDSGTSGGIWGLANGYCLMIGASPEAFTLCQPIFKTLAPPDGYAHLGPSGAGHYVKMVHNGIEYGMMAAYAEGLGILRGANIGKTVWWAVPTLHFPPRPELATGRKCLRLRRGRAAPAELRGSDRARALGLGCPPGSARTPGSAR